MSTIKLICLLLGDDATKAFGVEASTTDEIERLKDFVKQEKAAALNFIDSSDLILWKVRRLCKLVNIATLTLKL